MNAAVTISRCKLLSGRDIEANPFHLVTEEDLVLVPAAGDNLLLRGHLVVLVRAAGDTLLLRGHLVPILDQELLADRLGNWKRKNK